MPLFHAAAVILSIAASSLPAHAHEFWISPDSYQIASGEQVTAHLRVGQNFDGTSHSYLPANFARFEAGSPDALGPVAGRLGDRPALSMPSGADGLLLIVHETADNRVTYANWDLFAGFVAQHDLGDAVAQHKVRGIPETGFLEAYRRYAKSLIAVGDGVGADGQVGLEVEIVAETNPYTKPAGAPVTVRLFEGGVPRGDAQLEVFQRLGPDVTYTTLRTDAEGRVEVPVAAASEVLLNFVVLRPVAWDAAENGPAWRSLWASMTFAVPQ
ncbi:DUF4198 domain-containing protein [Pseudoruegeria sp. SK021]|uniref:DUF4198 domain-containing protein n=1 Tax=Pseudoruegeria sp. SK021 TaxID=1933035 RepID=UPI000A24934E|nr:DUF4198 domain-containing protein [Pseudoruegeria sp. SK021]OSP54321.1 hypothetical protein BV911_13190 [Pseudoruegeria sp. SK021]